MSKVKLIPGLFALLRMAKSRKARINEADAGTRRDPVSEMAKRMHPEELKLTVTAFRDETSTARTYRLQPTDGVTLPVFQAGQYISIKLEAGGSRVSRAYTISSAPYEATDDGYYEITVRRKADGFVSNVIWDTWTVGTGVTATGPHGEFYVSPLRDTSEIVAIAGGTGVTPFVSMMKQFAKEEPQLSLTLLYGCRDCGDVLFEEEIDSIVKAYPERFKRINTFEDNAGNWELRKGFVDAEFIKANIENPENKTFFICGPPVMYGFLKNEFLKIGSLERKQTRYEVSGAPDDVAVYEGFDKSLKSKTFTATVIVSGKFHDIPALASEPLLVAVERAELILDSRCRSGECGICRSRLKDGKVFILPDNDGRREADKDLGYIHPCATYPLSDVTIEIPPGKAAQT